MKKQAKYEIVFFFVLFVIFVVSEYIAPPSMKSVVAGVTLFVLFALYEYRFVAAWYAKHSIQGKINHLALSIQMLETRLEQLKVSSVAGKTTFANAQSDLDMAKTDLDTAKTNLASDQRHAANVAVNDGLQRAFAVRQFIAKAY